MSTVLVLKTVKADMTTYNGFKWPTAGYVEAPDWQPTAECGSGLHGFLKGEGDGSLACWGADTKWLVVEVDEADLVVIDNKKCKFRCGNVVFCGDRKGATDMVRQRHPEAAVIGACVAVGDNGHAIVGYGDEAIGGTNATLTGGDGSTLTGGYRSTLTGGRRSTLKGGEGSELRIQYWDGKRYRTKVGYIGEDGLEPNVAYKLDNDSKFVRA